MRGVCVVPSLKKVFVRRIRSMTKNIYIGVLFEVFSI